MSQAPPKRPRRLGLILLFALVAALALGWSAYWFSLRAQATHQIEAFLQSEQEAGAEASARIDRIWGFPRELAFEIGEVAYAPRDRAWRATSPRLRLNINPINPQHIIVEAPEAIDIAYADGDRATLSSPDLRVSVRHARGALAQAGVEATALVYADPSADGRGFRAARIVVNVRPDPRAADAQQAAIDIEGLEISRPVRAFEAFGQTFARAQAMIVIESSPALIGADGDRLEAWRAAGGAARFESARVQWGPATITGAGRIGLDDAHRLAGRLDIAFEQPAAAIQALARSPSLSDDAKQALQLIALGAALSGDDLDTHVEAREGELSLGGVRVRTIDPVY